MTARRLSATNADTEYKEWMNLVNAHFLDRFNMPWDLLLGDAPTRDWYDDGFDVGDVVEEMGNMAGIL